MRITPAGGWWTAFGAKVGRLRAWLDSEGVRYARLFLEDRRTWLRVGRDLAKESGTWRLWGGVTRTRWQGEGELELWPFTPAIIDLIGPKRRGKGGADLDLAGAGIHWLPTTSREGHSIRLGLDFHALWSDADLESWQPYLAGLGRTDIIGHRLRLRSATIADLGFDLRFRLLDRLNVRAGAAQLIPLLVRMREVAGGGSGGAVGAGGQKEWGGLRWWFAFDVMEAFGRFRSSVRRSAGALRPPR
jgi:hypothetical protein